MYACILITGFGKERRMNNSVAQTTDFSFGKSIVYRRSTKNTVENAMKLDLICDLTLCHSV